MSCRMKKSLLALLIALSLNIAQARIIDVNLSCAVREKGVEDTEFQSKKIEVEISALPNGDGRIWLSIALSGSEMLSAVQVINKIDPNKFEIDTLENYRLRDKKTNAQIRHASTKKITINRNSGFISYEQSDYFSSGESFIIKGSGNCEKISKRDRKF